MSGWKSLSGDGDLHEREICNSIEFALIDADSIKEAQSFEINQNNAFTGSDNIHCIHFAVFLSNLEGSFTVGTGLFKALVAR